LSDVRKVFTLSVGLGLMVTACAPSPAEDASATTATVETTMTTGEATTTTSEPTTTTSAPDDAVTGCLVGTWVLDSEAFAENFADIFDAAGMPDPEVTPLGGSLTVELLADGSLQTVRDGWGFSIDTGESVLTVETNGVEPGTWTADSSMLAIATDISALEVDASIEVGGQVLEFPVDQLPVELPSALAGESAYTCSEEVLTLVASGVESVLNRSP
jgi:hypothetical protein